VQEKRQHQRVAVAHNVTCEIEGQPAFEGSTADISVGGMFVECSTVPSFGSKLTIRTSLGGTEVALPAVVRWTKPGGFGVQFGLMGARETHAITQLIGANR
jgi:type IV pilus assembly protein PilZ